MVYGFPELEECLGAEERLLEASKGRPRFLYGLCAAGVGAVFVFESVRLLARGSLGYGLGELLAGLGLLYMALWLLYYKRRVSVGVTEKELLVLDIDLLGRRKALRRIMVDSIGRAWLFKSTVMFGKKKSGEIRITYKDGKEEVLPELENAEYVLEEMNNALHLVREQHRSALDGRVRELRSELLQ